MKKNNVNKMLISFCFFLILFIANLLVPVIGNVSHTQRMWLILDACVMILSVWMLVKHGFPTKSHFILSFVLGLLMFAAYQGVSFSSVKSSIVVFLCATASFSVFETYPKHSVLAINKRSLSTVIVSIVLGLGVGIVWGIINLFLSGKTLHFQPSISCFLIALSPGILEEVCYRLVIFAFCLYMCKGEINTKTENFWCYFMMIVPHVFIHTPDTFIAFGFFSGMINIVLLSLIFGLPFAILQRKRDLTSAMIAHGTVDLIRFSFLGLPF